MLKVVAGSAKGMTKPVYLPLEMLRSFHWKRRCGGKVLISARVCLFPALVPRSRLLSAHFEYKPHARTWLIMSYHFHHMSIFPRLRPQRWLSLSLPVDFLLSTVCPRVFGITWRFQKDFTWVKSSMLEYDRAEISLTPCGIHRMDLLLRFLEMHVSWVHQLYDSL